MKSGIINVYKEKDYTSSDVVVILKKILQTKKVGHTGTLDPMAVGVLPICVGRATRLSDYIMDKDKVYEAELVLGVKTDTQDATGAVLVQEEVNITAEQLKSVFERFIGEIDQIPPMYSAIKVGGKKLYEYARKGEELQRVPRRITVYGITLLSELSPSRFLIRIHCSKGTYIRVLCEDIAAALGTYGHMGALTRTACADFTLDTAYTLEKIRAMKEAGEEDFLLPMDRGVTKYQRVDILSHYLTPFYNGRPVPLDAFAPNSLIEGQKVRVYAENKFCAMARMEGNVLKVACMLREEEEES